MFHRHRGDPAMGEGDAQHLFAGEWFEIAERDHDYMLEILPPLWMRADMFAMREFMTGSVTSIFFALTIDGRPRWFHGYCDLVGPGFARADEGSDHRARIAAGPRHDARRAARAHLVEHA